MSAPPPLPPPPPGSPHWLASRELEGRPGQALDWQLASFDRFVVQRTCDLFAGIEGADREDGEGAALRWPPFHLRRRAPIQEVLGAGGLLLALAGSGICAAYEQGE